ncbi:stage II sporulation protein D [Ammoniphilus sp. CFH 90114]|uniref:stage II sporulation protein D n=1 Tax=Ammoniphilus sp. CFH 90114 TaxID=2493665 RepID=UPI00100FE6E8|nr:stage II sporulation protein D [Ammoniphilus sp. CFH 90114]RXT04377.1 stage II sporulation protein D [Ammoniphilus sp. CFH 90114]
MKRIGIGLAVILIIVLVIPAIVTILAPDAPEMKHAQPDMPSPSQLENQIQISVYRTESKKVDTYPIEEYIVGVLSAEMPADFELEALKAQAMAARTYIVRRIAGKDFKDVPEGAHVTDTVQHQVFLDDQQRRAAWGTDYSWKSQRIRQAVVETQGKVLTFEGKPIDATFFSTSNGYTENSEEYWANKIPYLRSVEVPWDKQSPRYQWTNAFSLAEVEKKLGVKIAATASAPTSWYKVLETTTGNRVGKVQIGDKTFTGKEIREKLGLPSSSFNWDMKNGKLMVTTYGYGHGVGMSQWGAHGMAQSGKTATDIVHYFYQGIAIEDYYQWVQ